MATVQGTTEPAIAAAVVPARPCASVNRIMSGGAVSPTASLEAVNEHDGACNRDPEQIQPAEFDDHAENRRAGSKFESLTAGVSVAPLNQDICIACEGESATAGVIDRPAVNAVASTVPSFLT